MQRKSYTREQVFEATLKYFNGDELATGVWVDKYCLKDKRNEKSIIYYELTPDDMHLRMAKEFARIEMKYENPMSVEEIYLLFKDFKYIVPQGSPMAGIGNPFVRTSLSNCFVIGRHSDSYGGICKADEEQAQLMKKRGGVGQDISYIRPAGSKAGGSGLGPNAGTTLYMERYSNTTREVQQDGRRGALMLSISIDHPDAEKFIDKKMIEGKVTGANISVRMTDSFMKAVNSGATKYIQSFPIDFAGEIDEVEKNLPLNELVEVQDGVYLKKVNPQQIWKKLTHNSWRSAEPGILFWDTILNESPASGYGEEWKEASTNPCFTGDTKVALADGRHEVTFKDLVSRGEDVSVYCSDNEGNLAIRTMRNPRKTGVQKQIFKVTLDNDQSIRCTGSHKFYLKGLKKIEAKDLEPGMSLHIMSKIFELPKKGTTKVTLNSNNQELSEHRFVWEQAYGKIESGFQIHHINHNPFDNRIENLEKLTISQHNEAHKKYYPGETNGNFSGVSNSELYERFRELTIEKGRRVTEKEYLQLGGVNFDSSSKYRKVLGKNPTEFLRRLAQECEELRNHKVVSVKEDGFEDVYNGTVDEFHNYFVGEFEERSRIGRNKLVYTLAANCGEIPLPPYDSCRLISINVYNFVENQFEKEAFVNVPKLKEYSQKAQRLMDDLVDLELERIDSILAQLEEKDRVNTVEYKLWIKIRGTAERGRRTGLGILGLGDALAAMNFKYGTPEATEVAATMQQVIASNAMCSSILLAAERGPFLDYSKEKEQGEFLERMFNENPLMPVKFQELYEEHGRRNIGMLTFAPTGSTSLLTQTTGGIECLFLPFYFRKRKTDNPDLSVVTDENGDMWEEYSVIHEPFIKWYSKWKKVPYVLAKQTLTKMSEQDLEEIASYSPYFEATSKDVDYVGKVKMQGSIQQWVDHSISVTVNMPESVSEEVVGQVFTQAWKSGCKGVTVYRENSRGNVLASKSVKQKVSAESFDYISAMTRPKEVECDVYFKTARGEDYIVFVGVVDKKPYEVFALNRGRLSTIPKSVKKGRITKKKRGVYTFLSECQKYKISNIIEYMVENEMNETRTLSALLRHRVDPTFIVKDVVEKFATINSFHTVLGRVLKGYIDVVESCSECGGRLMMTDGCSKCSECGHSKCS